MNTWRQDRDNRVDGFILNELDAASRLGVTHYQIDDGWQQGLSRNSSPGLEFYGTTGRRTTGK